MKRFTFLFFTFILCSLYGCVDVCNDLYESDKPHTRATNIPYWDWTQANNYSYAFIQGEGKINISSPFETSSSANKDLSYIIKAQDFLPKQGWVLLSKVFGTEEQYMETNYPYFI